MPPYLRNETEDNPAAIDYRDWHVPLGRRFRALKLWFVLRSYGAENLRTFIRSHVTWAEELESKVINDSRLELAAPRTLALVCFRHTDGNDATRKLADAINASGSAYVTPSVTDDVAYIRVSIGSTWTEQRHVEDLWNLIDRNANLK